MSTNGRLPVTRPRRVTGLNSEVINQPFNLIEEGSGRTQKAHVFGAPNVNAWAHVYFSGVRWLSPYKRIPNRDHEVELLRPHSRNQHWNGCKKVTVR